jgi:hypothetical protein
VIHQENVETRAIEEPLLGLELEFPESLHLLYHPASDRYGCYRYDGIHGLACFSDEAGAFRFAEFIDLSGMTTKKVSFEQAREIAKDRPKPVVALMLLDDMAAPQIHYVK